MRFSFYVVVVTAFSVVQAATPTVVTPTADATVGVSIDFKYVNPDRTETNPRFASSLLVSLANSTVNKAFSPGPKFSDDDPTTATATLTVDTTELVEGQYSFVVIEDGPSGSIFEKDFLVTLSFDA
ncbi:hypothetical protein V8D89_000167 [Ganoderma adspersum]